MSAWGTGGERIFSAKLENYQRSIPVNELSEERLQQAFKEMFALVDAPFEPPWHVSQR